MYFSILLKSVGSHLRGDTPSDEHYNKVRSKLIDQKSSGISQCDCKYVVSLPRH